MIAIISATEDELSYFVKKLDIQAEENIENCKIYIARYLDKQLITIISGVGFRRAKNATNLLITRYRPEFIVSAGVSGALDPSLSTGEIVIGKEVISVKKNERFSLNCKLPYIPFSYRKELLLSHNSFINNKDEKLKLFEETGACCVDMETWAVASVVDIYDTDFISVRVISDDLKMNLPRMEKLFDRESVFVKSKALKYFINNPMELYSFIRFRYFDYRKAKIKLNSFISYLIPILSEIKK